MIIYSNITQCDMMQSCSKRKSNCNNLKYIPRIFSSTFYKFNTLLPFTLYRFIFFLSQRFHRQHFSVIPCRSIWHFTNRFYASEKYVNFIPVSNCQKKWFDLFNSEPDTCFSSCDMHFTCFQFVLRKSLIDFTILLLFTFCSLMISCTNFVFTISTSYF